MLPSSSEESKPLPRVDTIDLDSCFSMVHMAAQRKKGKELMVQNEGSTSSTGHNKFSSHARPIQDGDFELVPLGEDPTRRVKIGVDLPDLAKRKLKAFLQENVDLFFWSATEMPGLDPGVACHHLTIDYTDLNRAFLKDAYPLPHY